MADMTHTGPESSAHGTSAGTSAGTSEPIGTHELAGRAVDEVKSLGTELLSAVRDSAATLIDEQRGRAATEIKSLGNVLRSSAKPLDEAGGGSVARYAEDAARQIDDFADRLRSSSWSDLSRDVESMAQRWPWAFVAAAMAIGFVAGRVLLSAAPSGGSSAGGAMTGTEPPIYGGISPSNNPVGSNTPVGFERTMPRGHG